MYQFNRLINGGPFFGTLNDAVVTLCEDKNFATSVSPLSAIEVKVVEDMGAESALEPLIAFFKQESYPLKEAVRIADAAYRDTGLVKITRLGYDKLCSAPRVRAILPPAKRLTSPTIGGEIKSLGTFYLEAIMRLAKVGTQVRREWDEETHVAPAKDDHKLLSKYQHLSHMAQMLPKYILATSVEGEETTVCLQGFSSRFFSQSTNHTLIPIVKQATVPYKLMYPLSFIEVLLKAMVGRVAGFCTCDSTGIGSSLMEISSRLCIPTKSGTVWQECDDPLTDFVVDEDENVKEEWSELRGHAMCIGVRRTPLNDTEAIARFLFDFGSFNITNNPYVKSTAKSDFWTLTDVLVEYWWAGVKCTDRFSLEAAVNDAGNCLRVDVSAVV